MNPVPPRMRRESGLPGGPSGSPGRAHEASEAAARSWRRVVPIAPLTRGERKSSLDLGEAAARHPVERQAHQRETDEPQEVVALAPQGTAQPVLKGDRF